MVDLVIREEKERWRLGLVEMLLDRFDVGARAQAELCVAEFVIEGMIEAVMIQELRRSKL